MTSPLSPEAVAQMVADREAGTPGPWPMETVRTSCGVCHKIGPWPHKWRAGDSMSACIYDDYPSPPEGTDTMLANARRIARLPDLEAAYLTLAAENATLRADNHMVTIQRAEVVERLMDDIATLRASEAAALERAEKAESACEDAFMRGMAHGQHALRQCVVLVDLDALTPTANKDPT